MSVVKGAMRGVPVALLTAQSVLATRGVVAVPNTFTHHTLFIKGGAGVASGAVQPESAESPTYAGTWAQIGGGPITVVASTELQLVFEGTYEFIAVRISTVLVGGTVDVTYVGS